MFKQMGEATVKERVALSQRFADEVIREGYSLAATVDDYSRPFFDKRDAHLVDAESQLIGPSRRQVVEWVLRNLKDNQVILWCEPEKWTVVKWFLAMAEPILDGSADIVVPRRKSLASYPHWQIPWEQLINACYREIIGMNLDYCFGPKVLSSAACKYWLAYPGGQQNAPDTHDSIVTYLLDAKLDGMRIAEVMVDYEHPASQTAAEVHDRAIMKRRMVTLTHLVDALVNREAMLKP